MRFTIGLPGGDDGNDRIWRRFGSDDLGGCVAVFFCAYIDGR